MRSISSSPILRWHTAEPRSARVGDHRRGRTCSRCSDLEQGRANAQPILDMIVTDSGLEDVMRPVFLTFAATSLVAAG